MSLKSYSAGSDFPPLEDGKLRLYSMRFDPLAQRARLVLAAKKIPYETVNINLVKKPDWFTQRNPQGTLPVIEHDGKIVYESMIVCEYLDSIYPDNKLIPTDAYQRARQQMVLDSFSRVTAAYLKAIRSNNPEVVAVDLGNLNKTLESFEKNLTGNFFGGDNPTMVDYCIWPWFERFGFLKTVLETDYDLSKFNKLSEWISRMKKLPAVKETETKLEDFVEFHKSFVAGRPDYDIGL